MKRRASKTRKFVYFYRSKRLLVASQSSPPFHLLLLAVEVLGVLLMVYISALLELLRVLGVLVIRVAVVAGRSVGVHDAVIIIVRGIRGVVAMSSVRML